MDEAEIINFSTYIISLVVLEISVYSQRQKEAWKSYRLEKLTETDSLTGIPNMRGFDEVAPGFISDNMKNGRLCVYLVFDITNFQTFNDRYGYTGGDELLKFMAKVMSEEFRDEPFARLTEDYFVALTTVENYERKAKRVRERLWKERKSETYLDVKTGVFPVAKEETESRRAVDRAVYAMMRIKHSDHDYLSVDDEKLSRQHYLRRYVLNNLDRAIQEGFIEVFYQPLIWTEDESVFGCEALARWNDPEMGFLSPAQFIPILEESRQIHKLDKCVYEKVCAHIRECLDSGKTVLPTSLNFSRLDFELMDAVGTLDSLVQKYDIPKSLLHVEITESALSEDVEGLQKAISKLHEMGYVVWLDDFGSGYSSMNVLKDFKFELLKIDMEFLKNFNNNVKARKIIKSIIDIAVELNMATLTEGVETQEMVDFLRESGCNSLQGYFYGKPMKYDEILGKIESGEYKLHV